MAFNIILSEKIFLLGSTKRCFILLFFSLIFSAKFLSQNIIGNFYNLSNQQISLEVFHGFKTFSVVQTKTDENGNFKLNYSKNDFGVGLLICSNQKPYFVILNGENIVLSGQTLSQKETIKIQNGPENIWFETYAKELSKREQALNAWSYLKRLYSSDSLFLVQQTPIKSIEIEINRLKQEDLSFITSLPQDSYVRWYLPTRKLVSSVSSVAQYRPEEIPNTIASFRALDYTDQRLYKSGLFKDAIESHFWLLENSGKSLDSVFIEMKISIDAMMSNLIKDEKKLNEVTDYLFDLLERHSLFQASEYLALKVLNDVSCTINNDLAKQLETYRAMKKGNIAPDFMFYPNTIFPSAISKEKTKKLSDLQSPYTLMVFGASNCPRCQEEIPEISKLYAKWKQKGVEVVFISLDDVPQDFTKFTSNLPFISSCDFKKWSSPIVESYYVFGTPTMFLLDNKREILLRPNSVKQMDAWVDWFLGEAK